MGSTRRWIGCVSSFRSSALPRPPGPSLTPLGTHLRFMARRPCRRATGSQTPNVRSIRPLARKDSNQFPPAALNIVELVINVLYLYSTYRLDSPVAPLFGFAANLMTLSKTALYLAQEYFCGFCNIGHNTAKDLILYYVCTNG